ncbi:MAG: pyridoxamine kinase [Solobacterium sp.]|nr:pyridoxamine kinase [Solobacterium sp.]
MKRIATMQDISCIGKCSLTVALPVISAMGIEAAVLPTAVLSTHTMFSGFTFHDLTDQIRPIMAHWQKEGFAFDGIYTGYLGSLEQIAIARSLFETFGKDGLILVDPCMADNGKLYTGFTPAFAKEMAKLCGHADIICPNLSEASFLLDIPYEEKPSRERVEEILKMLTGLGTRTAVLTGISYEEGKLGAVAYDRETDTYTSYFSNEEKARFHGTGDLWASAFFASLIQEKTVYEALQTACEFVRESVRLTLAEENHVDYGVNFEQALHLLNA